MARVVRIFASFCIFLLVATTVGSADNPEETVWPVEGPMTSGYLSRRMLRTNNGWQNRPHLAIDIGIPTGTAIRAVAAGHVVEVGNQGSRGRGKYVVIRHADGWKSFYYHFSAFRIGVSPSVGQTRRFGAQELPVAKGEIIGLSGSTGNVTGPHLHLRTTRNGRIVNPMLYIRASSPMAARGRVIRAENLNVRVCPTTRSNRDGSVSRGTEVRITGRHQNRGDDLWYEIDRDGTPRWVSARYIELVEESEEEPEDEPVVSEEEASDPPVMDWEEEESSPWADHEPASPAGPTVTADSEKAHDPEPTVRKGRVTAWGLNARSGPGTDHRILDVLSRDEDVEIVDEDGNWYAIRNSDPKEPIAWVHKNHVEIVPVRTGKVTAFALNARSGPGTGHSVEKVLHRDDAVEILDEQGNWFAVRTDDDPDAPILWVHRAYIGDVQPRAGRGLIDALDQ